MSVINKRNISRLQTADKMVHAMADLGLLNQGMMKGDSKILISEASKIKKNGTNFKCRRFKN